MTALSFLNSILGGKREVVAPHGNKITPSPAGARFPATPKNHAAHADPDAILLREEIVDSHHRLCGYRFVSKSIAEHRQVPEQSFFETLHDAGMVEFAQRRKAVVPISPDGVVFGRYRALLAPNAFFLMDARKAAMRPEDLLGRLLSMREVGCRTALTGVSLSPAEMPLLQAADMVFLDLSEYVLPDLQNLVRGLRSTHPNLALAAEGVQSWTEQRMCSAWGFEFCLGEFLSKPDKEEKEGTLSEGRLTSMEMLNLLRRDAELSELANVAKRDPGITLHVLQWANSPAAGLSATVTSLCQAIMVMGREHLYRWLMVSMFRMGEQRVRDESLLEIALTRARFLETIASPDLSQGQRDELFLVGLLSLFDILLSMPMQKILSKMHLSDAVADVLLRSAGPYGHYLMLALVLEKGRMNQVASLAAALGIATETLDATRSAAFAWAQQALDGSLAA